MNIGEFKNINAQLLGSIYTAAIHLPRLGLRPIQSDNANAPKFEIVTLNAGRRWVQIGALWEARSNRTGEVFLQGSIDDPSFAAPMSIALFGNDEDGYRVAWTRNRRRANGFGQSDGSAMGAGDEERGMGGDAFEGNADRNGGLIGNGGEGQEGGEGEASGNRRGRRQTAQAEEPAPAF